jgi:hypothetical protein
MVKQIGKIGQIKRIIITKQGRIGLQKDNRLSGQRIFQFFGMLPIISTNT